MPKATWGAGDNPLTADDIEQAQAPESRARYSGEVPPGGTYRFTLGRLKKDVSSNGNDMIRITAFLDGDWKPNHKQYNGAPLFTQVTLTKSNAPNVKNFLESIGATSKDLMTGTITDESGFITKLGRVGDPEGIQVYVTVKQSTRTAEYPNPRLETAYAPFIIVEDDDADDTGTDDGAVTGDGDDEPPF